MPPGVFVAVGSRGALVGNGVGVLVGVGVGTSVGVGVGIGSGVVVGIGLEGIGLQSDSGQIATNVAAVE
jgi:hypothetical protein